MAIEKTNRVQSCAEASKRREEAEPIGMKKAGAGFAKKGGKSGCLL